jgi:hypothetical protein
MSKAKTSKKEEKKTAKAAPEKIEATAAATQEGAPAQDADEMEEQMDAAASASGNSNAEALAAATGASTEMSASFKNFRHHPDMENFYRFIFENDLRHEALAILDEVMLDKTNRRAVKFAKGQAH